MAGGFWKRTNDGVDLFLKVTPNASKDTVEGLVEDADGGRRLAVRVRAVPEKGKANSAVEKLLAKTLRVPKSSVSVVRGDTHRLKTVRISADGDIGAQLDELLDTLSGERDAG